MSRRALLVGINGFAPRDVRSDVPELKGCVNDAELMGRHLKEDFDFPESEVRILRDEKATGEDVRRELGWLLSDYDDDGSDVRVFHISTHGTQVRVEVGGDEAEEDGLDEAFVVHDHEWGEPFRDNEIRGLFAKVPENVSVIFQADCCHSGNISSVISIVLDLPEPAGNELTGLSGAATLARMRALHRTRRRDELEIASQPTGSPSPWPEEISIDTVGETRRILNPEAPAFHDDLKTKDFRIVGSEARHILISACEDAQESKEFRTREGFHGGLTWAISKTIEERKKENRGDATQLTYKGLIEEVGRHLRFSAQTPLLECREDALDSPLFSTSVGRRGDNDGPSEQGDHSNMSEQEQTSADQLILFLMNYAASPKRFKSQAARLQLMKDCGLHPMLIEAMKTRDFDNIAQALSGFSKPIGDEGGGRPIGDEGGSRR